MTAPVEVTFRDIEHSDAVETRVREKAAKLSQFHDRIVSCRVVIESPQRQQHQGKLFAVRIDLNVPGKEIVVNKVQNEDVYVAIRDAFDAATRQLEDFARRQRGDVKNHTRAG
jgi:ribosomal subunit interface protein